ncbi:extracellular solute-binding protein [Occultella glacieicola]|uniref:Extracellular solute-binding protein n=1 Tax=Occultella glacieicola TaxID=2518684 RepID=A0ABY2DYQ0_9MICO|nr:extracellular solute-binding protein [Occultella glacieicola]TDE89608.1 extracellular solute-binding protein [Occultella glacieicola]
MSTIDRRAFLGAGGAALVAGALAGCRSAGGGSGSDGSGGGPDGDALRVAWYGGQPAHEGIEGALAAFGEDHPDSSIATEKAPFGDYWDRLATQVAGGDGPDVLRMSMTFLAEYADRGALLDLGDYVGEVIDTDALDEDVATSGALNDGLYGIGQSSITHATFRNTGLASEHGLELPEQWSWADFTEFCTSFAEAAGPGKYGSTDAGGDFQMFEVWARQHGTDLFDEQGLAVGAGVIEEWLVMWQDLRAAGAVPPPDVTAESDTFETSQLSQLNAAVTFGWVQQVAFLQPLVPEHPLAVGPVPGLTAGSLDGQFVKALDFWCVMNTSANQDTAAELIDFLLNDERAVTSIGLTLGVPPSESSRELLALDPETAEGRAVAFVDEIAGQVGPSPEAWPTGYGELQGTAFPRLNQDVGFGAATPADAAAQFVDEAARVFGS